jgi:hypothetical protein
MGYPIGPLLGVLAGRILSNLDLIERQAPKWGSTNENDPPYSDTQLLVSLLGVLVFPHERVPGALGELLRHYKPLHRVLDVVWSPHGAHHIELTDADGQSTMIDPTSIENLPNLLRNSIAHFNILPLNKNGRFGGIRIWNRDRFKQITFVADLDFDELRRLARHVLLALRDQKAGISIDDPPDPMKEIDSPLFAEPRTTAPRLNQHIWDALVAAHRGNTTAAKIAVDRLLKKEADKLMERMSRAHD